VVKVDTLNVRGGPGTVYDVVGSAHQGDKLRVIGQANDCGWLKVVVATKPQEWVSGKSDYVSLNVPCAGIPTAPIPPTPTPLPRRLATGTLVWNSWRSGLGKLTIENGRTLDAVAVLTMLDRVPVVAVYVRGGDSFTISDIGDGTYHLYFTIGEDWDGGSARFTRQSRFLRFEDPLTFITTWVPWGRQYTVYQVTLHGVPSGTARTVPVDAGQFPDLQ
jgi:hypothetical protein